MEFLDNFGDFFSWLGKIINDILGVLVDLINVAHANIQKTPLGNLIYYLFVGIGVILICFLIKRK